MKKHLLILSLQHLRSSCNGFFLYPGRWIFERRLLILLFFPALVWGVFHDSDAVFATTPEKKPSKSVSKPLNAEPQLEETPFKVTVTESRYLPPEMYGQWSVAAYLTETNAPEIFPPGAHDLWILAEESGEVTVTNPVTGASASVNVDEVKGNTATFHRQIVRPDRIFYEIPTVTVEGDRLYGTTLHRFDIIRHDRVVRSIYAKFRLEAQRLSGPRVRFGENPSQESPRFEIEDIQPGAQSRNSQGKVHPLSDPALYAR